MRMPSGVVATGATILAALTGSPKLAGDEWAVLGPRAMGMGGAGVAVTRGALGVYWNPAGLAGPWLSRPEAEKDARCASFWDVEIPISANATATNNLLGEIDDVGELVDGLNLDDLEQALDAGTGLSEEQVQDVIRLATQELPDLDRKGTGLVANASAGLLARVWRFGISAIGIGYAGGDTRVDLSTLALGDEGLDGVIGAGTDRSAELSADGQALADSLATAGLATQDQAEEIVFQAEQAGVDTGSTAVQDSIQDILEATQTNDGGSVQDFLTQNGSGVDVRGILLREYALSFAWPFFDVFSVGANAKVIQGTTYTQSFSLRDFDGSSEITKKLFDDENREESFEFGVDVGALFQPFRELSIGVVGRNLNRPKFDTADGDEYVVEPQVRAGIGVSPLPWLVFGADIDVLRNHSEALPDYRSQVVGGGMELSLADIVFLRGGVSKNLAEDDEDLMVHAGLGIRVFRVQLDVAASLVPDFTEITRGDDGDDPVEVPERAGVSVMLSVNIPLE